MRVGVVGVPGAPGRHEEQEGGGAGGVAVPQLQGAALLPAQVTAGNQIPEDTRTMLMPSIHQPEYTYF